MGQRREQRTRIALPVKVYTRDAQNRSVMQMACTMDLAPHGARLGGLHTTYKPDEILQLERGKQKAFYRVVWVGSKEDGRPGQIGLQAIEKEVTIWGFDLLPGEDERYESMKQLGERRKDERFPCAGTVHIFKESSNEPVYGELAEINSNGCFIRMGEPASDGTRVRLQMKIPAHNTDVSVRATVVVSQKTMGMGVKFTEITPEEKPKFEKLMKELEANARQPVK